MAEYIDFIAVDNTDYRAVLIRAGETPHSGDRRPSTRDRIQFFDSRYPMTPDGQFIAEYYAETLMDTDGGLRLPEPWSGVSANTLFNLCADFYPARYA